MRKAFVAAGIVAFGAWCAATPGSSEGLGPDAIFSRARSVWRTHDDAPFVQYALRERYTWRSRTHDNWWQASFRQSDRALALHRQIVEEDEKARLRGTPISFHFRIHNGAAKVDSMDTNADADAFPILDPHIDPDASFGLSRSDPGAALVGNLEPTASPSAAPKPRATPEPTATTSESPTPGETPLRVLVTVEAASRDYRIELAGTERIRDADAYHLTLTPLRDPDVYRLRDLWVDTASFETRQLTVAGLFAGEPYRSARWVVSYVDVDGHSYIQQIHTDDQLRFGMDRFVSGLQFDFVQYTFPPSLPDITFDRYL